MQENLEEIRRRIDLYRRYLRSGVTAEFANLYLHEIAKAELTLAELKRKSGKSEPKQQT